MPCSAQQRRGLRASAPQPGTQRLNGQLARQPESGVECIHDRALGVINADLKPAGNHLRLPSDLERGRVVLVPGDRSAQYGQVRATRDRQIASGGNLVDEAVPGQSRSQAERRMGRAQPSFDQIEVDQAILRMLA